MSVSYCVKVIVGRRFRTDLLFAVSSKIASCGHAQSEDAIYCPKCGKLIMRSESSEPTMFARYLFPDRSLKDWRDLEVTDASPDSKNLQIIDVSLTGDAEPELAVGVYLLNVRVPDEVQTRGAAAALTLPNLTAAFALVKERLREAAAGVEREAELIIAPYVSY